MTHPDRSFAQLVSLACHDLRTPLATVSGFARTLTRMEVPDEQLGRYLGMIEAASDQMAELLEDLGLAARIEGGRWEPLLEETDSLALAVAAAGRLDGNVEATGRGGPVAVEVEVVERALASLALCALRHGALERVELRADGPSVVLDPVPEEAACVCLAEELRDMGAAVAVRAIAALGGTTEREGETLAVRLPLAPIVS